MTFKEFQSLVKAIEIGKHLPEAIYLHQSAISHLPFELQELVFRVTKALKINSRKWTLLKLSKRDFKFSLLSYPSFSDEPYPALNYSWTIDLSKLGVREANYATSENPPILHRRETFVAEDHPQKFFFGTFTKEGETIGLYENTRIIGTRNGWDRLIKRKGYFLNEEGNLQALTEKPAPQVNNPFTGDIQRHKTALTRDKLSVPLFLMAQRGYLNGNYTVLDYGCGKGDDLRELEEHDVECIGWDPVYQPESNIEPCDIVNLGYVINVIEDKEERIETLKQAYSYSIKLLIVSAMLGNESIYEEFKPYKDGVITARKTFQKYYSQGELRHFIESCLDNQAVALAPGIFAVFKDKIEEQKYLLERQRTRQQWRQLTSKPTKVISHKQAKTLYDKNKELVDDFWYTCLELGRIPADDEFEFAENLKHVCGSLNKAFQLCKQQFDIELIHQAERQRINDLLVYFALGYFNKKRDTFSRMPIGLQRDIKAFFGKYSEAREQGSNLLFSVSEIEVIFDACLKAHNELPASELNGQHDLVFHKDYLGLCPVELRVYVGCATQLYGELDTVSLIKAHILSGKVSLMVYDDWGKDVPLLTERIKIKLREQDIDFFDYVGEFEPQPLINKSAFLPK